MTSEVACVEKEMTSFPLRSYQKREKKLSYGTSLHLSVEIVAREV